MSSLTIGLIGNPNAGKTTLFNQLTGAHQRVGNWPGVTVERKLGQFSTSQHAVTLVDLPGVYSLTPNARDSSLDERVASSFLLEHQPDVIINVVDGANLERNLYLTLQLRELGVPCILALNMLDIAQRHGIVIDQQKLAEFLGCPVVPLVSSRGRGVDKLHDAIDMLVTLSPIELQIEYDPTVEDALRMLEQAMPQHYLPQQQRWLALQMLEGEEHLPARVGQAAHLIPTVKAHLDEHQCDAPLLIAATRYEQINRLLNDCTTQQQQQRDSFDRALDHIALNRWLGLPVFLLVMYLMFFISINVGGGIQPLFDGAASTVFVDGIQWLGYQLSFPNWLTIFLAQGIGGGITTVLPLIPQIGLMYLCLAFLEDSGYMARAAFVVDRVMQALGLPGKSFVPLIVGFGCNVPAIMGARTLNSPRERLMTIMMAPFMSCGARLAIFAVFAGAFFSQHGASIVFSLYLLGIVVALFTGWVLRHTLLRGEAQPFVMELPPYHCPRVGSLLIQTWLRLKGFVLRAGKVIVCASIVIGGLNSLSITGRPVDGRLDQSALASVSQWITPALQPIGIAPDHWQATVGLVTGAMAKEVVISTLNTLYTADSLREEPFDPEAYSLWDGLKSALTDTQDGLANAFSLQTLNNPIEGSMGDGSMDTSTMGIMASHFGSGIAAYSYLIFVLLYVPCASVMGTIARETSGRWMMFSILWGLDMAYSVATLFYQLVTFADHPLYSSLCIGTVVVVNALLLLAMRQRGTHMETLPSHIAVGTSSCSH
ncbi:Fe(2+) transporter permease subunit FeoB [Zymobacter sp. IVIA_12111.31 C1]|uniref:Fe(2+) transporter permease subunit FeoB n=1 Tax=Zymobacter sp. IVIA_12111.31 C1 TaxID=3394854 RepID=UPI0039C426CC